MSEKKLLSPKAASKIYPISISLFYQLAEERRLAHIRVGGKGKRGKLLFDTRDIEAFLLANRVEAR